MTPLQARAALAAIVILSAAQAALWAVSVPLLQGPDENVHLDYVFALEASGHLLSARDGRQEPDPSRPVTPLLALLERRTDFADVRQHPAEHIPAGYGSDAFRRSFDAAAGSLPPPSGLPFLVSYYPVAYYALAALVMGASLHFVGAFEAVLAVRMLSVAMLAAALVFAYALYRRLNVAAGTALVLTGVLGLLPLTAFVASYAQPDNLALLANTVCLYLGVIAVQARSRWATGALGAALALLALTKYQDFAIVFLAVMGALWASRRLGPRTIAMGAGPAAAALCLQAWISLGPAPTYFSPTPDPTGRRPSTSALHAAIMQGPLDAIAFVARETGLALFDYFGFGQVSISFWGRFGWLDTPLVVGDLAITVALRVLLLVATLTVIALVAVRLARVVASARRDLAGAGRRLLLGNPLVTSYLGFLAFMVAAYVYTGGSLYPQGRYWVPFLPGLLYVTAVYAPAAVRRPRGRRLAAAALAGGLAAYVLVAAPAALGAVRDRYYGAASPAVWVGSGAATGSRDGQTAAAVRQPSQARQSSSSGAGPSRGVA